MIRLSLLSCLLPVLGCGAPITETGFLVTGVVSDSLTAAPLESVLVQILWISSPEDTSMMLECLTNSSGTYHYADFGPRPANPVWMRHAKAGYRTKDIQAVLEIVPTFDGVNTYRLPVLLVPEP